MKTASSRQANKPLSKRTQQLYGRPEQNRVGRTKTKNSCSAQAHTPIPTSTSTHPALLPDGVELCRDVHLETARRKYPDITPRDDYDILMLATNRQREGTTEEILAWVDSTMEKEIRTYRSRKAVMRATKLALDCAVSVTGRKPRPGKDTVFVRPIPDSQYSIRLWAGSAYTHEFCMDFIDSVTGHAVNSPFKFELWIVPDPDSSWLGAPAGCVRSLERNFGISQDKILPGAEKFILRDGQTCLIKRPGKRDILFTVPVRKRPERTAVAHDAHVLDFPKEV